MSKAALAAAAPIVKRTIRPRQQDESSTLNNDPMPIPTRTPAAPARSEAPLGLPVPQRYWAVATIALALIMSVLDGTIVSVALPAIAAELGVSAAQSVWVVNAYQLAIMVSLLPLASLGDIFGYRLVYLAGLLVFTIASLICATTDSLSTLVAARVLQGVGAAGVMSVNTALVRFIYPPRQLGRGIGINTLIVATSASLGPTVAAGILAVADWPWLFAINVPFGLIALLIGLRALPHTPRSPHRFDIAGAVLNMFTFGLIIISIDGIGHGEAPQWIAAQLLVAVLLGTILIRRELSRKAPLLPVDLLRIPIFALSIGTSVCSFTGQMLAFVSLPFFLQTVLGRGQVETGLLMTPWPLAVAVIAPIAGRLADRYPAGLLGAIGLSLFASGLALLGTLPDRPSDFDIVWRMALCGFGFGLFQSPNNRTIISSAPRARSGGASGMLSTARLLGQTSGAALAALIFNLLTDHGSATALLIAAAFAIVAAGVSLVRVKTPLPRH